MDIHDSTRHSIAIMRERLRKNMSYQSFTSV